MKNNLYGLALFLGALIVFVTPVSAQSCYRTAIQSPNPFMGNHDEIFRTSDGALGQVQYEYSYMYEYMPTVVLCPGVGKLIVGDNSLQIRMLSPIAAPTQNGVPKAAVTSEIIESQIDGEFQGWEGETIFKLMNGQIWQQASYAYTYSYSYMPKVMIYREGGSYRMKVNGTSGTIAVRQLR